MQVLREWLGRMEDRVPRLQMKPRWNRDILEQRAVEFKVSFTEFLSSFGCLDISRATSSARLRLRPRLSRFNRLSCRFLQVFFSTNFNDFQ